MYVIKIKKTAIVSLIILSLTCMGKGTQEKVWKSQLAGFWYPAESDALASLLDGFLNARKPEEVPGNPVVFILPHAGYSYSGMVASAGYRIIKKLEPDIIAIIGPPHRAHVSNCALPDADSIETPLGLIRINKESVLELAKNKNFPIRNDAFPGEHSIEIHLPMLQRALGARIAGAGILPILVGDIDEGRAPAIADAITGVLSRFSRPLVIVSSDFTHYGDRFGYVPFKHNSNNATMKRIRALDMKAVDLILKKDLKGFSGYVAQSGITICGRNPILTALAMKLDSPRALLLDYDTSGNITGDFDASVSYAAIVLAGKITAQNRTASASAFTLSEAEKKFLLFQARRNIAHVLKNGSMIELNSRDIPALCTGKRAAFVTLKKNGELRGCIGTIVADRPLYKTIIECSYSAAFRDPRFSPLENAELSAIRIEISVLTDAEQVKSLDEIQTGRDGLIIEKGVNRGLLLPQVATEQGWDRDAFISHTCIKAGLPGDAWKDPAVKVFRFQAIVFGEESMQ